MGVIYILLSVSVFIALLFFIIFIIATKKGQYDDLYTPSIRMLFEDELVKESQQPNCSSKKD